MTKPRITNTTKQAEKDPGIALVEMMVKGSDGFIEGQEAAGQRELVSQTEQLPTEGSDNPAWAQMGVVFGEKNSEDPLFRKVTLPAGWQLKATDHSMWSALLDEKGRKRAGMFYKAAFYDRGAHIHPERRFWVDQEREIPNEYESAARSVVRDANRPGEALFVTPWVPFPKKGEELAVYAQRDAARKDAEAWLTRERPQWNDPAAYWNE